MRNKPRSAFADRPRKLLYFIYGANMYPGQILSCCATPRVVATARLADHRIGFFGHSSVWDGGLETVTPSPGHEVWGVVYELSFSDADSLDAWQGVRLNGTGSYFHFPAEVTDAHGVVYAVLLYKKDILEAPREPSRPYLDRIVQGACEYGLAAEYIETLRRMASRPPAYAVPRLGSARPGIRPGETCSDCGSLAVHQNVAPSASRKAW
jgi:hypothetical protein